MAKKEDSVVTTESKGQVVDPGIDIKKYLDSHSISANIDKMLLSLFKGLIKTVTEWEATIKEVLSRKA
jgi:hypothetical protein